jgi:uncharacterized protein YkwD
MKKKFKIFVLLLFVLSVSAILHANTTRDLGNEPDLNIKLISKWIIFYTNIERVKNNLAPIQYDPDLGKAAYWQAEYNTKTGTLEHIISVKEMSTPKDRIEHFGGTCGSCGENLTVKFAINSEGIRFTIKNDSNGTFNDYGANTLKWRNEQEMGYSMLDSWMKSPGHRKNILNTGFIWMGAGIAKGMYSNNKSYYGCQVFNGYGGLPHNFIKAEYRLAGFEAKKSKISGKDAYIISYNGTLVPGVIEVNKDKELKPYVLEKKDNKLVFIKSAPVSGELFAALYDKEHDILYPVMLLK